MWEVTDAVVLCSGGLVRSPNFDVSRKTQDLKRLANSVNL